MDLNQHLNAVVQNLVGDITANVMNQVTAVISSMVSSQLQDYDFAEIIKTSASEILDRKVSGYQIDNKRLEQKITDRINQTISSVEKTTEEKINEAVSVKITSTNFTQAMANAIESVIADRMKEFTFPENSIAASSINFKDHRISGDCIQGGLITEFSSTGIDDKSTQVAITILDDATIVENNLLTKDLTVEGMVTVNGQLLVNGSMVKDSNFYTELIGDASASTLAKLDTALFNNYSQLLFNKIKDDGLDLKKITLNGTDIISENKLGPSINESNLQKLGILKELQVSGESLLAETLYVSGRRIGINTIEPSAVLSVWDEEIEITAGKKQKDTGHFGTTRNQKLVLSSNGQNNVILDSDGSAKIDDLRIGSMRFTAADKPPSHISERGHVVWNTNPNPGGPMGWICLGAANWANFGIID